MIPLLGSAGRAALARFARPDTLLAFDYDGTLAPIVADPQRARLRPRTHTLLARVSERYPTIVITGRSRLDLLRRLSGLSALEVIGNHGLETAGANRLEYVRRVKSWHTALARELPTIPGLVIEDKRYSLALHYRYCPDPAAARTVIRAVAQTLNGVRRVGGKSVLNLIPAEAPNKGHAVLAACARRACARALYIGDDETDEDVFILKRPATLLTVRVEHDPESSADYCLRSQEEMDPVLAFLLERSSRTVGGGQACE